MGCHNERSKQSVELKANLVGVCVENIETSLLWYVEKLDFEVEKEILEYPEYGLKQAFLKSGNFHLELVELEDSYKSNELLSGGQEVLGGMNKLGLKLGNFEEKFEQLQKLDDVEFLTDIGELPPSSLSIDWPAHYFLIKDPDGNYIQFFDGGKDEEIIPWLIMIIVDNLESSINWYSQNLGFFHHQTVGETGNRRAILERDGYVLELFEPNNVLRANEMPSDSTINKFTKIAFSIKDLELLDAILDGENMEIVIPVEDSDFDWATRTTIVKDNEGNWIQLFEVK